MSMTQTELGFFYGVFVTVIVSCVVYTFFSLTLIIYTSLRHIVGLPSVPDWIVLAMTIAAPIIGAIVGFIAGMKRTNVY